MRRLWCAWALVFGCTAEDEAGDEMPPRQCETETRADTYAVGLAKDGESIRVEFVDAMPAPPARYDNRWVVRVLDEVTGEPLAGCESEVTPWMIDHMHGTSIETHVTPGDSPGEYVADPVNLHMPDLWRVTLDFTCPGEIEDSVEFFFCVDP